MFGIGLPEMTIVLVIVLVVFGAAKLPALGTGMGKSIQNFKKAVTGSDQTSNEKATQQIEA
jgi:sec-independent protein translocase protein TatA